MHPHVPPDCIFGKMSFVKLTAQGPPSTIVPPDVWQATCVVAPPLLLPDDDPLAPPLDDPLLLPPDDPVPVGPSGFCFSPLGCP
jgi:hypothetical protein